MTYQPHRPPASASVSAQSDRGGARADSVSTSHRYPNAGGVHQDHGSEQDWWSRLSQTQIDMLRPLSAQLFEKLDDTLFDRSGSSFQQFFEGMRILRKNRDALLQGWFDRVDEAWNRLKPQAPGAFRPRLVSADGAPVEETVNGEFALIDEVTLERKLAIDSAVARGLSLCRMELPPLCHRLTLLRKGAEVAPEEVPAAPLLLVQTFAKSLDEVQSLPVEVALIVFKLFDRVVINAVDMLCKELNRILVAGGIAPRWTWAPSSPTRSSVARPAPQAAMPSAPTEVWEDPFWLETVPALDQAAPVAGMSAQFAAASVSGYLQQDLAEVVGQQQLTASVRALLEHRRMARYAASWAQAAGQIPGVAHAAPVRGGATAEWGAIAPATAPRTLELGALMEVLASLPSPALPTSWVGEPEEAAWDPGQLKNDLSRSLHGRMRPRADGMDAHGGAAAHAEAVDADMPDIAFGEHEDVIDMVAMMFSFIQQDQALPAAVQALLSRLQLPYLRLALSEPQMFFDAEHPARALMDHLAEFGKSCAPGSPMLAEKMLKMHSLVGRIVGQHEITRAFVEQEWTKFRTWSDALEQRAAARERDQVSALIEDEPQASEAQATEQAAPVEIFVAESATVRASVAANEPMPMSTTTADVDRPASTQAGSDSNPSVGRAHLHQIRLDVTARMRERIEGKAMPEGLRHALSLLWVNHQVRVWEKFGERSYEASWLDRQLAAVAALFTTKQDAKAQEQFAQDWPGIERAWSQVLAEGSAPVEARTNWIATFRRWAEVRIGRVAADPSARWNWREGLVASDSAPSEKMRGTAPSAAALPAGAGEQAVESAATAGSASTQSPGSSAKLAPAQPAPARWAVGDWIEFKDEPAAGVAAQAESGSAPSRAGRGKVSWIGSFTGRTVLVKTDGTLWREEDRVDLDALIDRGLAFIVPRESLFNRSMQSMFAKLREDVASVAS
ncbi:MAG: DUF1631 family protein [Proteobacteria bacterium]|nr:DUF1631 family protein [Pseudomonadota bacterium]